MKRFVLSAMPNPQGMVRLYEEDYHYLVRVRRLKSGACFDAILPGGTETRVRILSTVDNILIGECLGITEKPANSMPQAVLLPPITLFQGLPRGSRMDLIVRQAAETGLSVVAPFQAEYSTAKLPDSEKIKRWERIVREARQQSGSATETKILLHKDTCALLGYWASTKKKYQKPLGLLLHQEPLENGTLHGYLCNCPDFVVIAVGPEGGFSPGEVSQFLAAGFKPLLMGNTVLRTETAALYGTSAVRTILLESKTWTSAPTESCSSKFPLT